MDLNGYIRYAVVGIPRDMARALADFRFAQLFIVLNLLAVWALLLIMEHDFLLLRAGLVWGNGLFLLAASYTSYVFARVIGAVFYAYGAQEILEFESQKRSYY
ncbi:MAG: hypothetical protein HYT09_03610 [Candidatus Levybacteria bacterium]|nr:hypothetical protein [Candidatus Levybacteria bacterium]